MKNNKNMKMVSGTQTIVKALEDEGVELITSFPGASVLSLYNEILKTNKELLILKHEADAAFAADSFIRNSRKKAVVIASSGPGSTNLITALANAKGDYVPLIGIVVSVPFKDQKEFQEANISEIAKPVVKKVFNIDTIYLLKRVLHEAFCVAWTHPRGPVLVNISKDILSQSSDTIIESGICPVPEFHVPSSELDTLMNLLKESKKPLLLVGKGALLRGDLVRKIVEIYKIPVATTVHGAGVIPEDSDLSLGFFGRYGNLASNKAINNADLIISLGVGFNKRYTMNIKEFAKQAKKVNINSEVYYRSDYKPDLEIVASTDYFLELFLEKLEKIKSEDNNEWLNQIKKWKKKEKEDAKRYTGLHPINVIKHISSFFQNARVVTGNGQHKYWTIKHFNFCYPGQLTSSAKFGSMGFGVPAAIGAKKADDKEVVLIIGDGDFQMSERNLAVITENNLKIVIIVMNNRKLGNTSQLEKRLFGHQKTTKIKHDVDFASLAKAYGVESKRIDNLDSLKEGLKKTKESSKAMLLDVRIDEDSDIDPWFTTEDSMSQINSYLEE